MTAHTATIIVDPSEGTLNRDVPIETARLRLLGEAKRNRKFAVGITIYLAILFLGMAVMTLLMHRSPEGEPDTFWLNIRVTAIGLLIAWCVLAARPLYFASVARSRALDADVPAVRAAHERLLRRLEGRTARTVLARTVLATLMLAMAAAFGFGRVWLGALGMLAMAVITAAGIVGDLRKPTPFASLAELETHITDDDRRTVESLAGEQVHHPEPPSV